jgi:hypothetical protein
LPDFAVFQCVSLAVVFGELNCPSIDISHDNVEARLEGGGGYAYGAVSTSQI